MPLSAAQQFYRLPPKKRSLTSVGSGSRAPAEAPTRLEARSDSRASCHHPGRPLPFSHGLRGCWRSVSNRVMDVEPRLNIVTLGVTDLARARRFYEGGLGWKASAASQGDIVFFQLGGMVLALYPREMLADDANVPPSGSGFRGVTLAQNVRDKADVDASLRAAEEAGGRIMKSAQDAFWGGYSGYFADPDGHLWEVAWNPYFVLDKLGTVVLP